jgi:3-keto-5-aminohexanoate cleavage enzyme
MSSPIIICCAPVPGEKQREKHPGPLDPAAELIECHRIGAAIGHLHARDDRHRQSVDVALFRRQCGQIRSATDMIIEGSTGGAPEHTLEQRAVTFTVPLVEMGSLNLGSVNMYDGVYQNRFEDICFYATKLRSHFILPIMPVFDLSHLINFRRLIDAGHLSSPFVFEFVWDVPNAIPYSEQYLKLFHDHLPSRSVWFSVRYHQKGVRDLWKVIDMGGHVRCGFEDSPYLSDGRKARNNMELVEDCVKWVERAGRKPASSAQARELLGLKSIGGD